MVPEAPLTACVDAYPLVSELDWTSPMITWFNKTLVKTSTGISSKVAAFILVKNASKASFVGAKTVKAPGELRVASRPVTCNAETKVLKLSVWDAKSTIEDPAQQTPSLSLSSSHEIINNDKIILVKF